MLGNEAGTQVFRELDGRAVMQSDLALTGVVLDCEGVVFIDSQGSQS